MPVFLNTPRVVEVAPRIKVSAAYGRLYVQGEDRGRAARLPGAADNQKRKAIELSLTLESLRGLRKAFSVSKQVFARLVTPEVLEWAKRAGQDEQKIVELHKKIDEGYRITLPWYDAVSEIGQAQADNQPTSGYKPPFAHQEIMATVALELDGSAYLCEMGTGKTRAACEVIRRKLETDADIAVVFCPRGVMGTWQREIQRWTQGLTPMRLIDSVERRKAVVRRVAEGGLDQRKVVLILNYDVLYLMETELAQLCRSKKVVMVCDEMHRLSNPHAKSTASAMKLAQLAYWRLGMTGTPVRNTVTGIWSQWYIIDLGQTFGANYTQFRREWFRESDFSWDVTPIGGDESLTGIGLRLRRRGLRYRKEDCLDLPPKLFERLEVEMSREQWRAYREMEQDLVARLTAGEDEEFATAATQLVAILRLTQITSGFVPNEEGVIHRFTPNPKLDAIEEEVRGIVPDRQGIIWALYREDHDRLMERFADLQPQLIRGGMTDAAREKAELDFQAGRCPLIIGQPSAGGVGLNLFRGSAAWYYSQGYSLIDRLQSEDRCHRSGTEMHRAAGIDSITYTDVIATGTIDEVISDSLEQHKEVAEVVVDLKRFIGMEV